MSWDDDEADIAVAVNTAALKISNKNDDDEDATLQELLTAPKLDEAKGPAEPEKIKEKHILKAKEKERNAKAAVEREAAEKEAQEEDALTGAESAGERHRRLRELQMKQEMEMAAADFGGGSTTAKGPLPTDPTMLLAAVPLSDGESFVRFGNEVSKRVHEASGTKSLLAMKFYNELLNYGSDRLSATELVALIRTLETKERAKRDAEKKAAGKGKGAKAKGGAKVNLKEDYGDDYEEYEYEAPKAGAAGTAATGTADAAGKTGNVGNVAASLANAGLDIGALASAAAEGQPGFVRTKFTAEDDFM